MLVKKLIPLVKEYLQNNSCVYIDIQKMSGDLQDKHSEYSRNKRGPFRKAVEKAYEIACQDINMPRKRGQTTSESESEFRNLKRRILEDDDADCLTDSDKNRSNPNNYNLLNRRHCDMYNSRFHRSSAPARTNDSSGLTSSLATDGNGSRDDAGFFFIDRSLPCNGSAFSDVPAAPAAEIPSNGFTASARGSVDVASWDRVETAPRPKVLTTPYRIDATVGADVATSTKTPVKQKNSVDRKRRRTSKNEDKDEADDDRNGFSSFSIEESKLTFDDVCGIENLLTTLDVSEIFTTSLPKGIVLHGPEQSGKQTLAKAIVGELGVPYISIPASKLMESQHQEYCDELIRTALLKAPCAVLVDDILHGFKTETNKMDDRVRHHLSEIFIKFNQKNARVHVIAIASNLVSVDKALLKKAAFEIQISVNLPKKDERLRMLEFFCKRQDVATEAGLSFGEIAQNTPSFSPGDLEMLVKKASVIASHRLQEKLLENTDEVTSPVQKLRKFKVLPDDDKIVVTMTDFMTGLTLVTPSAKHAGDFTDSSNVTWDDIGGMSEIREQIDLEFLGPIRDPMEYEVAGLSSRPTGMLLHGPPGCGKTLIVKALANEADLNLISVNGPQLLTKYVGESERLVREIFERAKKCAPCIIYFDEMDGLFENRDNVEAGAKVNVVSQILPLMDGVWSRGQVYVIGSTNRIDRVDPALKRPGRFDRIIYVGPPDSNGRLDILRAITKNGTRPQLSNDISLEEIAADRRCSDLSGADLSGLVRSASLFCIQDRKRCEKIGPFAVSKKHFDLAFETRSKSHSELTKEEDFRIENRRRRGERWER